MDLTWIGFAGLLFCIGLSDYKTKRIPNELILLIACTALAACSQGRITWEEMLMGAGAVSIPMTGICVIRPGAFGGGDIKLMAAAGMYLGAQNVLEAFCYGIILGGVYGTYILIVQKRSSKESIALGPFLVCGIMLSVFFRIYLKYSIWSS